jgi:hypothetical protein
MKFYKVVSEHKILSLDRITPRAYVLHNEPVRVDEIPTCEFIKLTEFEAETKYEYVYEEHFRQLIPDFRNHIKLKSNG